MIAMRSLRSKFSSSATSVKTTSSSTNGRTVRNGMGVSSNSLPWILSSATCLDRSQSEWRSTREATYFSIDSPSANDVATDEPGCVM